VVDYCLENGTPLLAAGDLYDVDDPDPESVAFVHRQCDRLQAAGIPLLFTVGQHERHRSGGTWMGTHPWPTHAGDGRTVEVRAPGGLLFEVRGFDWAPASEVPALLERYAAGPEPNVLMLHQVAKELMGSTTSGQCEIALADVPGDAIILIGDYHVSVEKRVADHRVYSPGSLALQEIDADPRKSFWVLDTELRASRVPIPGRPVAHYTISEMGDLDAFLADRPWEALAPLAEGLPEELRRPIVSVSYPDELPAARKRLVEALSGEVHLFDRPVGAGASGRLEVAEAPRGASRLEEALDAAAPRDSAVHALLSRLLKAERRDLPAELEAARREFLARWGREDAPCPTETGSESGPGSPS